MNKKLTTVAVSAITAWAVGYSAMASAEATVYGRVVAGAVYSDNDKKGDDGAWNFGAVGQDGNNGFASSRFGFKGETDLGNGLTAGFKIEREVDGGKVEDANENSTTKTAQRHNLVYLSGGFGTVTLGNQGNPYMNARHWDQTNFTGGEFGASYRHEGINYSMSNGPFSLNIMALGNNANVDGPATSAGTAFECGAGCAASTMVTPAGGPKVSGDDGIDGWIIHAGYDFGPVALNVAHHADNLDVDIVSASADMAGAGTSAQQAARVAAIDKANAEAADDSGATRDRTAIGVNGSFGPVDWNLAYEASELNTNVGDNDTDSIGGFLGFNMSERDVIYGYYVDHSADRPKYDDGDVSLGDDYSETIFGYSRQIGPGVRFIAEYNELDKDIPGKDEGSDPSKLLFAIKMDF